MISENIGRRFQGLWRNANFLKLWAAQTVSVFGTRITFIAVPLFAALTLQASPAEMGMLTAASELPALMLAIFIGVWVDRLPRRPILIVADIGRALLLIGIPVAVWTGILRIEMLFLIVFLVGVLTVFFDVAYQSFLPAVVRRDQLVEGNSKLATSVSGAVIIGPALAGGLVQIASAAIAILIDAISYLISAVFLGRIDAVEPGATSRASRTGMRHEIGEGLRMVFSSPILRTLGLSTGIGVMFYSAQFVAIVLYVTRDLGLSAGTLGLIFTAGGVGYLAGALLTGWTSRRFGLGRAILGGLVVAGTGDVLIPMASGPVLVAVPLLLAGFLLNGIGGPIYDLNQVSLRQAVTPDHLLGRVTASLRVVIRGAAPVGAVLGGFIAEWLGLRATLVIAAFGAPLSFLVIWLSPVRSLIQPPPAPEPHP